MYWRISTWIPERAASSADLSSLAVISPSTYSSPQFAQTLAGTPLKTRGAPFFSRVTVVFSALVSPFLQTTHFMVSFSTMAHQFYNERREKQQENRRRRNRPALRDLKSQIGKNRIRALGPVEQAYEGYAVGALVD